jgi:thiamine monophosphate synthase
MNVCSVVAAGATIVVTSNAIFSGRDPEAAVRALRAAANGCRRTGLNATRCCD